MAQPGSLFLALPQEIRDHIYFFAFDQTIPPPEQSKEFIDEKEVTSPSVFGIDTHTPRFITHYPSSPPLPTWHNLLLCCRQTNQDARSYFASQSKTSDNPGNAVAEIHLTSTSATISFTSLPTPTPKNLQINLRLTHLFDAALTGERDNRALRTIFDFLKRYLTHGAHLSRPSTLSTPLQLDLIEIDVAPAWDFEDMQFFFGNPKVQLLEIEANLSRWIAQLSRCGALEGRVGRIGLECGCLAQEEDEALRSTKGEWEVGVDPWDEETIVRFEELGYRWD